MLKIFDLTITSMSYGGEGLGSFMGKKVFVPHVIVGEKVRVKLVLEEKDYVRAKLLEVLEASPQRVEAPCPYYYNCGGCHLQHIHYPAQVEIKDKILQQFLSRIFKNDSYQHLAPILSDQNLNYRTRIRLQVSRQGEIGFFEKKQKHLIPIDQCLIASQKINEHFPKAKELARKLLLQDRSKRYEIEIDENEHSKVQVAEKENLRFHFKQVNTSQNTKVKLRLKEIMSQLSIQTALELYAGDGNLGFDLSMGMQSWVAIENDEKACHLAEEKIKKQRLRNTKWMCATAYRGLEQLKSKGQTNFDLLLLDPPRAGAAEIFSVLSHFQFSYVLYLSCDPSTLARDLKAFKNLGYSLYSAQLFDFFPQTYHMESLCLLMKESIKLKFEEMSEEYKRSILEGMKTPLSECKKGSPC